MYFLLAIAFSIVGIGILLWSTEPKYTNNPKLLIDADRWIDKAQFFIQKTLRNIIHICVVHLVNWYRIITHNITIHKTLRQKVREILYEHYKKQKQSVGKDHLIK